jgi:hypothetical protein
MSVWSKLEAAKTTRFQREVLSPMSDGDDQQRSPEYPSTVNFRAVLPQPLSFDASPAPAVPRGTLSPIPSSVPGTRQGNPSSSKLGAEEPTAEIDNQNVTVALIHDS